MIVLNFKVEDQKLTKVNIEDSIADKTHNILQCVFDVNGDDWEDKEIFAILYDVNHNAYELALVDNAFLLPYDVVKRKRFKLSLYSTDNEADTRITTNQVTINMNDSGFTTDVKDLEDIDVDIWTQIFEGIDSKSDSDHTHTVSDVTDFPTLHAIATSGDYEDLDNIPSEFTPSEHDHNISDVNNLQNTLNSKVDKESGKTLTSNDFTDTYKDKVDDYWDSVSKNITSSDVSNWNAKQDTSNLVTEFSTNLSDALYPSEKLVKNYVDNLIGDIQEYVNR